MPYTTRTAVLNTGTPDIDLVLRKVTLGEGAISSQFTTNGYPIVGAFSGSNNGIVEIATPSGTPDYIQVCGISKFGWGLIDHGTYQAITPGLFGWSYAYSIFAYGGPYRDGYQVSGVYDYKATKTPLLPAFDGGNVSFVPSYATISVDWGITNPATTTYDNLYGSICEAPLASVGNPAFLQTYQWDVSPDPEGVNSLLLGLECRMTGNSDTNVELNTKMLFAYPSDGAFTTWQGLYTLFPSPTDATACWSLSAISDGLSPKFIISNFTYKPMWASPGVLNTPTFTHYVAAIAGYSFDTYNPAVSTAVRSGHLLRMEDGTNAAQWLLVNPTWVSYQRLNLIGGEQAWCNESPNFDGVLVQQDTDGTWLVLTHNSVTDEFALWIPGAPAEGFTGCPFDPPFPPWPAPTPPVGNPLIRSWGFSQDGHDFYVLRLGEEGTLIYDATTGQWSEWDGSGAAYWRATLGMNWIGIGNANLNNGAASNVVAGDIEKGILWSLDPELGYDDSATASPYGDYFTRAVRGGIPFRGRHRSRTNGIWLTISNGAPTIPYASVTLRTSDDQGRTWTSRGTIEVIPSDYSQDLYWRSLGLMRAPGRLFEFEDNGAMIRIDGATIDMSKDDQGGDS